MPEPSGREVVAEPSPVTRPAGLIRVCDQARAGLIGFGGRGARPRWRVAVWARGVPARGRWAQTAQFLCKVLTQNGKKNRKFLQL